MSTANEELIELLRDIRDRLDALAAIAESSNRKPSSGTLSRIDRDTLSQLLPQISFAIGDAAFLISDATSPEEPELRHAFEAAVGPLDKLKARRLGKLFSRANGFTIGSYRIDRIGEARAGARWRVSAVK